MRKTTTIVAALLVGALSQQAIGAEPRWLDYDADTDMEIIKDAVAFGDGPDLVLKADSLEGARINYGNPTVITYEDGSSLTLKRYTQDDFQQEYGKASGSAGDNPVKIADIPSIMLQYNLKPSSMNYDNTELVKELQEAGKRLLAPLSDRSERFHTQSYNKRLWFILGEKESIGFITHDQKEDQYVMVRAKNMEKSEFLARVVRGALQQPKGSEWNSEQRNIPQQHMTPLPK